MIDLHDAGSQERLASVLHVRRWVDEVASGGPYPSLDALVAAGERAVDGLSDAEVDEAIAADPRIGRRGSAPGTGVPTGEQEGLDRSDEGFDAAITRGDQVYQDRFDRPFLIRASGRSGDEVLEELQRRLKNDPDQEADEVREQLRQIAALRLRALLAESG